jgi:alanyl-tRNA synthetase
MQNLIDSSKLRSLYLEFFEEKRHVVIPSASLVPANDPTVLFTTAGMHPLVPYLLGEAHPSGQRLVDVQKCVRTGDIDVVGDDTHLTFFEMLGNWSLGDYYRDEAIRWSFELLTDPRWLGLPVGSLGVTCFGGDENVPIDRDSACLWESLGISRERIQFLGRGDNWWGPAGRSGPCGPDTEIFTWVGEGPPPQALDVADRRWVEIWNNVFMGFTKTLDGEIVPLSRMNVDTGMGLERMLVVLNGHRSVYEVDTMKPLYDELRGLATSGEERELRVVTDHLRTACFMIADGVGPSNKDRGYVLRRLLRRSILFARRLGMPEHWYERGVKCVVQMLGEAYPELRGDLAPVIAEEIRKFERTIATGLREIGKRTTLDGAVAFDLFQTHGFPFELTRELAESTGKQVDESAFLAELERHREKSRSTSTGTFEGGLQDHSDEIVRYHTLTHLLQAALREVLGPHVIQRGSNITRDRLRFDFSHDGKPTDEQLARVEERVNEWLGRDLRVERSTMSEPEARALGALGAFGDKYGEIVSVYAIRDRVTGEVVSRELCGGPHVAGSAELRGRFRIVREQTISAGIRRIKAVLT